MKALGDSHRKNVLCGSLGCASQHFELSQLSSELVWFRFQIFLSYKAQYEPLILKELLFLLLLHEKTLNLSEKK